MTAVEQAIACGLVVTEPRAFRATKRRQLLVAEAEQPGLIARTAHGVRVHAVEQATGRRVTGWRWVRGTHSGTCVPDRLGTDRPEWWS